MARKQKAPPWRAEALRLALSVGLYLAGGALVALLLTKGVLPEGALFPGTAAVCLLAALAGGSRKDGLFHGPLFAAVLLAVGLLCWDGVRWDRGTVLLACAMAGSLPALLPKRRKRR